MGHTWKDMDTEGTKKQMDRLTRLLELRREIDELPLGYFTAGDLEALWRIMGTSSKKERKEDLDRIERRVREIKSELLKKTSEKIKQQLK